MKLDMFSAEKVKIERLDFKTPNGIELYMKRDDQIHDLVSGNKLYKLKKNIEKANDLGKSKLITFGGAFSNHIAATACVCKEIGLKSVGIIRGQQPPKLSPTLQLARDSGMRIEFMDRKYYREKNEPEFLDHLQKRFPDGFIIPEGGANLLGIEGAMSMMKGCEDYDYIITAMGTGTTFAGLVKARGLGQKIIGIPIHKHDDLLGDIRKMDDTINNVLASTYDIINDYHFGGYAKWDDGLVAFMMSFYKKTGIKLDPVYTSKGMYGALDLVRNNYFRPESKVLFIHTGGMQGLAGFEERFDFRVYN